MSYATSRSTSIGFVASLVLALALALVAGASGAISPRSAAAAATGSGAESLSLARPGGAQPGDVMLAAVSYRLSGSAGVAAPPGWALIRSDACTGPGQVLQTQRVYQHLATGSEPAAYTWQFPSTGAAGVVVSYAGVDPGLPVNAHGGGYTRNSVWVRADSVTTSVAGTRVVVFLGRSAALPIIAPSGTTGHAQAVTAGGPAASLVVSDAIQANAGATGNRASKTAVVASCNLGQMVALRPTGTVPAPAPSPAPAPAPPAAPTPAPPPPPSPVVTAPVSTATPIVSGTPATGSTLTVSTGTWSGTTPMGFAFGWKSCRSGSCEPIAGAGAQTYVVKTADAGSTLRASVTASNAGGSATSESPPTAVVVVPNVSPPTVVSAPVVTGTAVVGSTLTATTGTWQGATPMSHGFEWSRCVTGGSCVPIGAATSATYTAVAADAGSTLRVTVTASNAFGLMASPSAPTATIAAAPVGTPDPGAATGSVVLSGRGWTCNGPVDLDLVKVTSPSGDAIVLAQGCTGRIGRIEVDTWTQDGVKVQNAGTPAHDVVIEGGYVACHAIADGAHQDAVQAMGGSRIAFLGVSFDCLGNSNFFVKRGGSGATTPTDITCDGCVFAGNSSTTVRVESSVRSGARNSVGCVGRNVRVAFYATTDAQEPVLAGNRELPHDDPGCTLRK